MRLSDWGRQFGRVPRVSWQMLQDGNLPEGMEVRKIGNVYYVREPGAGDPPTRTVVYARVSSSDQAADLVRQAERLQRFAAKNALVVDEVVMETGSGLNGRRTKLLRVLRCEGPLRLVVEHRDRLARFGFELVEASLAGRGGEIAVVDDGEVEDDLVGDVTEVLTSMCARLYGKRSAARRAERALEAAAEVGVDAG